MHLLNIDKTHFFFIVKYFCSIINVHWRLANISHLLSSLNCCILSNATTMTTTTWFQPLPGYSSKSWDWPLKIPHQSTTTVCFITWCWIVKCPSPTGREPKENRKIRYNFNAICHTIVFLLLFNANYRIMYKHLNLQLKVCWIRTDSLLLKKAVY